MKNKKSDLKTIQTEKRLSGELERLRSHVNHVVDKQNKALSILGRIEYAETTDIEEAAEAIVGKFEQLHNDYTSLEKEMRQLAQ